MQDINFDELDKAVSSIMQEPVSSPVPNVTSPPVEPTVSSQSAILNRPRGRFMDVIHPSSAMRPPAPTSPIHRQTTTITPLDSSLTRADDDASRSVLQSHEDDVSSVVAPPVDTRSDTGTSTVASYAPPMTTVGELPEATSSPMDTVAEQPLDSPSMSESESTFSHATINSDDTVEYPPTPPEDAQKPPIEPSVMQGQSPFVEGATVEKRPLGAFAVTEARATSLLESTEHIGSGGSDDLPSQENVPSIVSAPELKPLDGTASRDSYNVSESHATVARTDVSSIGYASNAYGPDHLLTAHAHEERTVFDAAQYQTPLTPPDSSHSGRKIVLYTLFVILLLGIGVVAGYLVFILKLV